LDAITAKMLKLKTELDMVKYLLRVYFSARGRLGVQDPLM